MSEGFLMGIYETIETKREEILRAAARHGARNIRIIGSVARGEADSRSDLDLLVAIESGRSLLDHAALILDLEELVGCKVDIASDRGLHGRLRSRILDEAIPL
jgi:predicted nucleotidyltransferase